MSAGAVTLTFVDGARGDRDLAANGTVTDPGGPSAFVAPPATTPTPALPGATPVPSGPAPNAPPTANPPAGSAGLCPKGTDITDQVVEVNASGENEEGGEVKENLVDQDPATKWLVFSSAAWAQVRFAEPVDIARYALTSADDAPTRDPRDWKLLASNDGQDWTTLDTRTDQAFEERFQTKEFTVPGGTAYTHYRLDFTRNGGANIVQLAEVQFAEKDAPPAKPVMSTTVGDGPTSAPAAKAKVGYTGRKAFRYVGTHKADGRAYSYNKVFDVDVAVTRSTSCPT